MLRRSIQLLVLSASLSTSVGWSDVLTVSTDAELSAALASAAPGDEISVLPGIYSGGLFRAGLTGVTIRGPAPVSNPAIIRGGINGIQLSDATDVTIERLTFEQQTGNGLNIDDGGSFATPSTGITLRDITVRDMNAGGNNDGIKLSGVTGFLVDRVRVFNWGPGGSAVDPVGSHNGVIQHSHFRHDTLTGGSGVRPKGGSKNIVIRGNLVELPSGQGRAIQAGGATGTPFFRFIDGDSGYEAADIFAYGNRTIGASSAVSWANIDGGVFRYNDLRQPATWAMRILNENQGLPIVDTANGVFSDNAIEYSSSWSRAANVGPEVDAASFTFDNNRWLNTDDPTPAGSTPSPPLPAPETNPQYGVAAPFGDDQPMRWDMPWGVWVVPLDHLNATVSIENSHELLIATPGENAVFDALADDPLSGDWSFDFAGPSVVTQPFEPIVLIRPEACGLCSTLDGDYNRNGVVDARDYFGWTEQFGLTGTPLADGNGDGVVDIADYTVWRDNAGVAAAVPEPAAGRILALLALLIANRQYRR